MPYTQSSILQNMNEFGKEPTHLDKVRARRQEDIANGLNERKQAIEERKQQYLEAQMAKKEKDEQQQRDLRKAAIQSLPPRPGITASPEAQAAWFTNASTHMTNAGFLEAAEEYRAQGEQRYGQSVTGPTDIASTQQSTNQSVAQEGLIYAQTELTEAETDATSTGRRYAGTAAKPPGHFEEAGLFAESIMSMPGLAMTPVIEDDVETDEEMPLNLNPGNQRLYVDTYRKMIDELDGNVEEAKRIMEASHKVIIAPPTGGVWGIGQDPGEQFIVPKGFIQGLQEELGHAPSNEEIIANWKYNIGAFEAGA